MGCRSYDCQGNGYRGVGMVAMVTVAMVLATTSEGRQSGTGLGPVWRDGSNPGQVVHSQGGHPGLGPVWRGSGNPGQVVHSQGGHPVLVQCGVVAATLGKLSTASVATQVLVQCGVVAATLGKLSTASAATQVLVQCGVVGGSNPGQVVYSRVLVQCADVSWRSLTDILNRQNSLAHCSSLACHTRIHAYRVAQKCKLL